jgi:hypothetical protein
MHTRFRFAAPLFLALPLMAACEPSDVCTELGACGGELVSASDDDSDSDGVPESSWAVSGTCTNEVFTSPQNASLINQPPPLQGTPPPEPAFANWCSEMVLKSDKSIAKLSPWFPVLPFQSGGVTYHANGNFSAQINYFGQVGADFGASCFETQGFRILPEGSVTGVDTMTCQEFSVSYASRLMTEPNITGVACIDDGASGCRCGYNLLLVTSMNGTYTVDGTKVNHYDKTSNEPFSRADYCVKGNSLELYGHERTFLFNQASLRSLTLVKQ